jgi:hypothetical protein
MKPVFWIQTLREIPIGIRIDIVKSCFRKNLTWQISKQKQRLFGKIFAMEGLGRVPIRA